MDIGVFQAWCPVCRRRLILSLDFYWWLVCECGYLELLIDSYLMEGEKAD